MKFANRYELFEVVTSGRVETFFAKDLASGERVLLHIFEAEEQKPDQPTLVWAVESFRSLALSPPGLVVEAGKYSGTTYAYLVTKLPANSELQQWVQSYESRVTGAEEVATPSQTTSARKPDTSKDLSQPNEAPTKISNPLRSAKPLGDFTAASSRLVSRANPESESSTSREGERAETTPPSTQTSSEGGLTRNSAPVASPDSEGFTALFQSSFRPETKAASDSVGAPPKSDDANAENFTDFFRGPFDGERAAGTPNISSSALDTPQRNAPGEFTRVFGAGKDSLLPTPPLEGPTTDPHREVEPEAFPQLFPAASEPATPSPTNVPLGSWEPMVTKTEMSPPSKEPAWAPPAPMPARTPVTPSIEPIVPNPTVSSTLREAEPSLPDGATHVFSAPGRAGTSPSPLPAGPSEYTRIIKGGMGGLTLSEEAPLLGGSRVPSGGPPAFSLPQPLASPPAPKIGAPPSPNFSLSASPPAPNASQSGKAPKPEAHYSALIIILSSLAIVAILLVMYFAIKH